MNCPGCKAELRVTEIYWKGFAVEFCLNPEHRSANGSIIWGYDLQAKKWVGLKLVMV